MKRCLSPKAALILLAVAATILLWGPDLPVAALPLLLLALCPLVMGAMMWVMMRGDASTGRPSGPPASSVTGSAPAPAEGLASLRARAERLRSEQEALVDEIARLEAVQPQPRPEGHANEPPGGAGGDRALRERASEEVR